MVFCRDCDRAASYPWKGAYYCGVCFMRRFGFDPEYSGVGIPNQMGEDEG